MTFLEIFRDKKSPYRAKAYNEFCAIFEDEFREYGAVSLLELRFSPDLKSLGFFYWLDENTCENVASMGFFDLKLIVPDIDFFDGDISAVDFYHRFLRLLKCEVIKCK